MLRNPIHHLPTLIRGLRTLLILTLRKRMLPSLSLMFLLHTITGDAETPLMIHVLPRNKQSCSEPSADVSWDDISLFRSMSEALRPEIFI